MDDTWTSTAAGTPMGDLLRRFWLPIAPVGYLDSCPIRLVSVLSEGLVLFRDESGAVGLMQQHCPHNGVMLNEGHIDEDGIVCREHGWHFGMNGEACLKLPSRRFPLPRFNGLAYRASVHGDLYWAYLGPGPAPALPADEVLVRSDGYRVITVLPPLAHNWLADGWCASAQWRRQFDAAEARIEGPDGLPALLLRLPMDDRHTQQLSIEFVADSSRAAGPKVVYCDENEGLDEAAAPPLPAAGDPAVRESLLQWLGLPR